jgi:cell wall-associated NlpC family hydrolase
MRRSEIVDVAKSYIGTPYRNGGTSRRGVDCSGLIVAVYERFNILLPRTAINQSTVGTPVHRSKLKPGDLVFFKTSLSRPVSHVGIYIGRGSFVHASTRTRRVRIDQLDDAYFRKRFVLARRVME